MGTETRWGVGVGSCYLLSFSQALGGGQSTAGSPFRGSSLVGVTC